MRKDVISSTWKGTSSPQAVTLSWEHLNRHTGGSNPSTHPVALPMNVTQHSRAAGSGRPSFTPSSSAN